MEEIPSLYPSLEEFSNPIEYLSQPKIQRIGHKYGMVKLVSPEGFNPPLSLNQKNFKFKVRMQKLSQLNLVNRNRLFFWKQLNNFYKNESMKLILSHPYVKTVSDIDNTSVEIYLYDIFVAIIKHFNNSNQIENTNVRKRRRTKSLIENNIWNHVGIKLRSLKEILNENSLWRKLSIKLNISTGQSLNIFNKYISKYYQYLYSKTVNHNGKCLRDILYEDNDPSSLLNEDSDEFEIKSDSDSDGEQYDEGQEDEEDEDEEETVCPLCGQLSDTDDYIECSCCYNSFHQNCLDTNDKLAKKDWICSNCIIGTGYYGFKEESHLYTLDEFKEYCKEQESILNRNNSRIKNDPKSRESIEDLEKEFWSHVNDMTDTLVAKYGADVHNSRKGEISGFPTKDYIPPFLKTDEELEKYLEYVSHPMNLINLPRAEGSLLPVFGKRISGMTVPWIYVGSKFSTFCWHLEDQYTLSANYQHEGAPKVWYSIPEYSCDSLRSYLVSLSPDLFDKQPDLMHQLVTLVSPYDTDFQKQDITCFKAVQYPNEYIITFPKCYHAGFNSGYNLNEAVNFTIDSWVPYGVEAIQDYRFTKRQCVFDMFELMTNILVEYQDNTTVFDDALARQCYTELLEMFNNEQKLLKGISSIIKEELFLNRKLMQVPKIKPEFDEIIKDNITGQRLISTRLREKSEVIPSYMNANEYNEDNDNEDNDNNDHEIFCSKCNTICHIVFVLHPKQNLILKQINLETPNSDEFDVYCLHDYSKLLDDNNLGIKTNRNINDRIVYVRDINKIRELLRNAGNKIDKLTF
ncbi:hypothetical protein Kpol_1008p7 [Vanderwaltozyma polyspora DSM 70294]|uniref:JmjC domain-containing protein n=1 Tax=Vanderwaltozyma polyspora (strain ATCC 22028 / DSM 70294 / BCRC 21397 / CBS 2163 / NBRC 10782 / NRRL Y-8283 / UCD 57-17) TaxID=436907 RepID=A7TPX2_VANPO|nr:uncharacterized protein Kpol_1008p7 [Vanderwaltozyma polyspora DSM 70294]EDO15670.1 hypothetical protein Kpol_1008p7 [Vanderwaltozyma polyspora DSM 70294]